MGGASATASLIVGGLIFALASRRRGVAKNVSKLQLSDDIEESGKLEQQQDGYKEVAHCSGITKPHEFIDQELALSVLYVCFRLLLLSFLNFQSQIAIVPR